MRVNSNTLRWFFLLNYLFGLWLVADSIPFAEISQQGFMVVSYLIITFLLYGLLYWIPTLGITVIAKRIFSTKPRIALVVGVVLATITTLLLYANAKLFALYGMYINGFVLNLILTPGGMDSLGGSQASNVGFGVIGVVFLMIQLLFGALAVWLANHRISKQVASASPALSGVAMGLMFVVLTTSVHLVFAYDLVTKNRFTLVAQSIPFYQTLTARHLFKAMGVKVHRDIHYEVKGRLNYPRHPLHINKPTKPYNIIWLTSESLRWDMLNDQVMPKTMQFSKQATRYTQNYSGGNSTRMGVFSMLMGLPSSYWFQFLQETRGAALIDVLREQQYQMQFYTSALFSYPEFDKTVFAKVPKQEMHERQYSGMENWQNDQQNVTEMLQFLDKRDASKPFFSFMFFESPHARYFFPKESVIATPYHDDVNYATLSKEVLRQDITLIKNRYINAVHHLDSQFARVFQYLEQHQLLENTIVIVIGDHGEEFMEHGFWGHNGTFVDQQVRTPLVIYMPGKAPMVSNQLTSHMDVVATLMPLLGVTNPKTDYTLGVNLFNQETRTHTYIADWDKIVYVDNDVKIVQPSGGKGLFTKHISTKNDQILTGKAADAAMRNKQASMVQLMQDLSHFIKKTNGG